MHTRERNLPTRAKCARIREYGKTRLLLHAIVGPCTNIRQKRRVLCKYTRRFDSFYTFQTGNVVLRHFKFF